MTTSEVITKIDALYENPYGPEEKAAWINAVESAVQRNVVCNTDFHYYSYPDDAEKELILPDEWVELYVLYAISMIDFFNRDQVQYNASAAMYEERYLDYRRQYIRTHPQSSGFVHLI